MEIKASDRSACQGETGEIRINIFDMQATRICSSVFYRQRQIRRLTPSSQCMNQAALSSARRQDLTDMRPGQTEGLQNLGQVMRTWVRTGTEATARGWALQDAWQVAAI